MLGALLCANAIIASCYFSISALIFTGLVKQRRLGFNPLGTATAFIFLTCGLGHAMHVEHYLLSPQIYRQDAGLWHLLLVDGLTVIPALIYVTLRGRYGLVIRGPHALLDFQRRLEVAEAIRDIGQDIAAQTDLDAVLQHVVNHARDLLGADYAAVTTTDVDGRSYLAVSGNRTVADGSANWALAAFAPGTSPTARAIDEREPVTIEDLRVRMAGAEFALHRAEGGRALLAVPLARGEQVLGSLLVAYRTPHHFTRAEASGAEALANQAAIAIVNAQLIAGLRQAERVKDEFLSVAAHELKTPVTSLRGFAQIVVKRMDTTGEIDPAQLRRAMHHIDMQSQKLSRLVAQLLDVSRVETGKLAVERVPIDIAALVMGVVETVRQGAPRRSILVDAPRRPLRALGDPLRLEQVVTNLLDNALKFSDEDDAVEVTVRGEANGTLHIAVTDHGVGIPEEHRARIFDRFHQAHAGNASAGMGLGLYMSAQIVALHGGSIHAEFPEEGGTHFVVGLPAAVGTEAAGVA